MEIDEVEELLIGLILEGKVEGRIDQVAMRLELDRKSVLFIPGFAYECLLFVLRQVLEKRRYNALDKWTEALESVHTVVIGKNPGPGRGPADPGLGDAFSSLRELERFDRY